MQKYCNPVTGVHGQKVSRDAIKYAWIDLQKIIKQEKNYNNELRKIKTDFYLT